MRFIHQPGSQPLSGYTIQRGIHRGGFGEVYYARSDGGKEVALKLLQHEQDVELRGVQQCLNLKHPNLVNLFDVRTDAQGERWVVMEYVNGTSLEDVLAAFPNGLPLDEVSDWLGGMVAGTSFLHDRGIVHRDLKPANIYRENGTVKVGDVGLSKRLGSDRRGTHTQSVGTVYYMAPEVARGEYGPEVDVYSLGVILYEMLTGRLPFTGETTAEVLMKHLTAAPDLQPLPTALRPVVANALEKDPLRRTRSAHEMIHEFSSAIQSGPGLELVSSVPVTTGFANGTTGNGHLLDTKMFSRDAGDTSRTTGLPRHDVATRTVAQSASAYARYPTDVHPESPKVTSSPVERTKPTPRKPVKPNVKGQPYKPTQAPSGSWPVVVAIVAFLLLFAPGSWMSWFGLLMVGAAYAAGTSVRTKVVPASIPASATMSQLVQTPVVVQVLNPGTRWTDLMSSLAMGSGCACLLSVGGILATQFFQHAPKSPPPEFMALFTSTTMLATLILVTTGQLLRPGTWFEKNSRKTFVAAGALIGAIAYGLDQFLLVEFPGDMFGYSPAFASLGVHPLTHSEMNPTLLGYMIFFGGLMFIHRWKKDMSPGRSRRLGIGRLFTAGIAAWIMTVMFAFPQGPAVLWAVTISAAVQLASTWSPRPRRFSSARA